MPEVIVVLMVVLLVLGTITVVGHGMWLILAAIFRGGARRERSLACPYCARSTPAADRNCSWCGRDLDAPTARELLDLAAFVRQVERLRDRGAVDADTAARLLAEACQQRGHAVAVQPPRPVTAADPFAPLVADEPSPAVNVPEEPEVLMAEVVVPEVVEEPVQGLAVPAEAKAPPIETEAQPEELVLPPPPREHLQPAVAAFAARPAVAPPPPRRSWAEMFASLSEERNIRWGELIGGLLFVCFSAALVISLWEKLERIPYFQFFIFVAISSGVFGVGMYAYHRLKLKTTGQGLLIIATLLVPLNFLTMAGLVKAEWSVIRLIAEGLSLGIFVWLVGLAAKILVQRARWLEVGAVVGNSAIVLLVARVIDPQSPAGIMLAVSGLPVLCFAAAVGGHLVQLSRQRRLDEGQVNGLVVLLGTTAFSMIVAVGLFLAEASGAKLAGLAAVLDRLSGCAAVAGAVVLASGLTMMRGTRRQRDLAAFHAAGTMLALLGMAVMLGALGLAWPQPRWIMAVAAINCAALVTAALRWRQPMLHAGAIASLTVAHLTAFHLLTGNLASVEPEQLSRHMLALACTAPSGMALVGLSMVLGAIALALARMRLRPHALQYLGGAAVLAVASLLIEIPRGTPAQAAIAMGWLSAMTLTVAWIRRDAALFAVHQVLLAAATVTATIAWLQYQGWPVGLVPDPFQPVGIVVLHVYGIALAGLCLAWTLMRTALRNHQVGRYLFNALWQPVDWNLRHVLVWAQLLLAGIHVLSGVGAELLALAAGWKGVSPATVLPAASGLTAWMLWGLLGSVLVAALWDRWRQAELTSSLLLAATAPCLIAGRWSGDVAVASALRWALAAAFVTISIAVWKRRRLGIWFRLAGTDVDFDGQGAPIARSTLVATMVLPVLGMTLTAAFVQLTGGTLGGPAANSLFAQMGSTCSYLAPLAAVMIGLVGYALRERSAGYAFSAGPVLQMIVTLGYALQVPRFDTAEFVLLLQLATITAAVWAIVWLVAWRWIHVWREGPLMALQLTMGIAGNAVLLGAALIQLALFAPHWSDWTVAAGMPPGWAALALLLAALWLRRTPRPETVGLFGMAVLGLLACTIQGYFPEWGYRTLMLGWASYALLVALMTWWVAALRTLPDAHGPPQALVRTAAHWVRLAGILAVLLGLKAAFWHQEQLWAAAAIAIASVAGATMAVWRRREGWAFPAALGVNLAASLVVWHFELIQQHLFEQYWLRLVEANIIASAVVALVWLAVRKRLYELRDLTVGTSPLLGVQIALPTIGNVVLLAAPVIALVRAPDKLPGWMKELATGPGWLALLLTAAAAAWYLRRALPGNLVHVVGGLALGAGVLAACYAANQHAVSETWIESHVLMAAWAATALLLLGGGWLGEMIASRTPQGTATNGRGFMEQAISVLPDWIAAIGLAVGVLAAVVGVRDPAGPWWSAGPVLTISLAAGLTALWLRVPSYVYFSGILINMAGTIVWIAQTPPTLDGLIAVNVLCLAIGSVVWSVLRGLHPEGVPHPETASHAWPFAHVALRVGMAAMGILVIIGLVGDLERMTTWHATRLHWIALGATVAAIAVCLADRSSRLALPGLYLAGLVALGLLWHAAEMEPRKLCWRASSEMIGYCIGMAALGWISSLSVWREVAGTLRVPSAPEATRPARWPADWFSQLQAPLAAVGGAVALWGSMDFGFDGVGVQRAVMGLSGRLAGMMGVLMLFGAAVVMAWQTRGQWRTAWQRAAFFSAVLLQCSIGWARLDPTLPAAWLHRSVTLTFAAAMLTFLSSVGLRRFAPWSGDWIDRGRQLAPALAGLAIAALAAVLGQEAYWFQPKLGAPVTTWEMLSVIAVQAGVIVACLRLALASGADPFGLEGRGRTLYVYAAEIFGATIGLHLWLTKPEIFELGIMRRYWMLIVMGIAFAGAGLSELFQRRKLSVLSEPLAHTALWQPLLPAAGFWFLPAPLAHFGLVGRTPAVWFLMGLFYAVMAVTQRSALCAVLSFVTANLGLWLGLDLFGFGFLQHPQLWLIPGALAALVAEYLNHDRLTEAQSTAFRYLALSIIYVSSTADMFITGVGNNLWLPMVLMVFAVAGMLVGIVLRIRSFLMLGLTFLLLDLLTIIWHAAVDLHHTWIWYACGTIASAAVITLFAIFEKRRNEVLAAVERFKEWSQ